MGFDAGTKNGKITKIFIRGCSFACIVSKILMYYVKNECDYILFLRFENRIKKMNEKYRLVLKRALIAPFKVFDLYKVLNLIGLHK